MTAASAAGDSSPPFYIGTNLASTMEDDAGWVLSVPRSRSEKISTLTSHGTYHAVAAPVENFPFLPLDNRRHEPNRSATTAKEPIPYLRTPCSIYPIDDEKHARQSYDPDEGFSPIICQCPFAFCRGFCPTAASLWKTSPAPEPRPTTSSSISPIDDATPNHPTSAPSKSEPVDLAAIRRQIRANMANLDRLFPPSTTMTTMPLTLRQLDPSPFLPNPPQLQQLHHPKESLSTSLPFAARSARTWQTWTGSSRRRRQRRRCRDNRTHPSFLPNPLQLHQLKYPKESLST